MKLPEKSSAGAGSAEHFLKIKNGESVRGIFRGESFDFFQHFDDGAPKTICPGSSSCDLCKSGKRPGWRFRLNFLVRTNGAWTAYIFEQGTRVYNQLVTLNKTFPLETTPVVISRTGSDKATTTYSVLPAQQAPISPETLQSIEHIPLRNLDPLYREKEEEMGEQGDYNDRIDDIPF